MNIQNLHSFIPTNIKSTFFVKYFGFTKVPLIFYVNPSVVKLDEKICVIKIPLNRRTKNHLNSMYFGVLATGADLAGGLVAMNEIVSSKKNISLSFKDFHADFLKRAEGDVHFVCTQVEELKKFVQIVSESDERHNFKVQIDAYVPKKGSELVATFTLTLSLKRK
jgi:acyl-coenzyme A thioesterase PaaI-like protein